MNFDFGFKKIRHINFDLGIQNKKVNLFIETIIVDIETEDEKQTLIAFLESMNFAYRTSADNFMLTNKDIRELAARTEEFISGKTTSRAWSEIEKQHINS